MYVILLFYMAHLTWIFYIVTNINLSSNDCHLAVSRVSTQKRGESRILVWMDDNEEERHISKKWVYISMYICSTFLWNPEKSSPYNIFYYIREWLPMFLYLAENGHFHDIFTASFGTLKLCSMRMHEWRDTWYPAIRFSYARLLKKFFSRRAFLNFSMECMWRTYVVEAIRRMHERKRKTRVILAVDVVWLLLSKRIYMLTIKLLRNIIWAGCRESAKIHTFDSS